MALKDRDHLWRVHLYAQMSTCTYLSLSAFSVLLRLSRDLLRDLRPLGVLDLLLDLLLLLDQLRERDLLYFGDLIGKNGKNDFTEGYGKVLFA